MQPVTENRRGMVSEMKLRTLKRICAMFCVNHIFAGTRFFSVKRKLLRFAGYEIGEGTKVVGPVFCTGKLRIGDNCWIGRDLSVDGNGTVDIDDNCDIAPQVSFLTGGHAVGGPERRAGAGETYSIRVGSGSWIGARATIAKNITIGSGCVIGACGCVVCDIPDHSLACGVPAKVTRELEHELQEITEQ